MNAQIAAKAIAPPAGTAQSEHAMAQFRIDGADVCGTRHHRWVCVDPVHEITDAPGACAVIATAAARSASSGEGVVSTGQQRQTRAKLQGTATARALAYVVGVDGLGDVSDVTRRYAPRWSEAVKLRIDSDAEQVTRAYNQRRGRVIKASEVLRSQFWWWSSTLERLTAVPTTARNDCGHSSDTAIDLEAEGRGRAQAEEEAELTAAAAVSVTALPTRADDFRCHPTFVLARFVGGYEMIANADGSVPEPVALFRGESVYDRASALQALHTAWRWKRHGRAVLESELARPVKRLPRRTRDGGIAGSASADDNSQEGVDDDTHDFSVRALYGEWQTTAWSPPPLPAAPEPIPSNAHGNFELWDGAVAAFLPPGAAWIGRGSRGIATIARKLGVAHAPALVGFERAGGRSVPVIDGVVVRASDADMLSEAHAALEALRADQAASSREVCALLASLGALRDNSQPHLTHRDAPTHTGAHYAAVGAPGSRAARH